MSGRTIVTNYSPNDGKILLSDNNVVEIEGFDKKIITLDGATIKEASNFLVIKEECAPEPRLVPNQLGMFTADEIRIARKNNHLLSLWINLSNVCNLKCRYCFNSAGKALPGELSCSQMTKMISDFKDLGGKKIVIVGSGEPTIDPNFFKIIDHTSSLGLETVLFTNGLMIAQDPSLIDYLWDNKVSIALKFHSFDKDIQDFLIGRNVSEKIYKAIDLLLDSPFKGSGRFSLANQVFKQNLADLPGTYRYCRDNDIIPRVSKILFKGKGATCQELCPTDKEVKDLYAQLKQIDEEEYGLKWGRFTNNVYAGDQGCQLLYVNLSVDAKGLVQSCIGILEPIGDITKESLAEIWSRNQYKDIDQKLTGPCTKCESHIKDRCYSCAGRNFLACGNAFSSSPCTNMRGIKDDK